MNILFLIFHGFDPNNGISKKISYQANALKQCGNEVHLCYMDEAGTKKRMIDENVIADYGCGFLSKLLKRIDFSAISRYVKNTLLALFFTNLSTVALPKPDVPPVIKMFIILNL